MRTPLGRLLASALLTIALAGSTDAGQVFVTVGSPVNKFTPGIAGTTTRGDFVIWTWVASGHTVTSGTSGTPNGIFDSDPGGGTHLSGTVFAWRTDRSGSMPYFCRPHWALGMTGNIVTDYPGTLFADFRITEVRFDGVGSDFVEIANLGTADGNLRAFRLSINGADPPTSPWIVSTPVPAGGRVVVSNPAGLSNAGSVALYAPYLAGSIPDNAAVTDSALLVDYVEWGPAGGQPLEDTAIKVIFPAQIWFAGEFAPQAKPGDSIVRCQPPDVYGSAAWDESMNPTPGAPNDCVNPTRRSTWGRLKALYR